MTRGWNKFFCLVKQRQVDQRLQLSPSQSAGSGLGYSNQWKCAAAGNGSRLLRDISCPVLPLLQTELGAFLSVPLPFPSLNTLFSPLLPEVLCVPGSSVQATVKFCSGTLLCIKVLSGPSRLHRACKCHILSHHKHETKPQKQRLQQDSNHQPLPGSNKPHRSLREGAFWK